MSYQVWNPSTKEVVATVETWAEAKSFPGCSVGAIHADGRVVNAGRNPAEIAAKIHPFSDYHRAGLEQSIADA